jgi:hypothetical protein
MISYQPALNIEMYSMVSRVLLLSKDLEDFIRAIYLLY